MTQIGPFVCLSVLLFLGACSDAETKTSTEEKKVLVEVIQVAKQPREEVIKLLGTVETKREMKLGFGLGGKIKRLAFEEGQLVKEGVLLAELDTTELIAKREKALENKNKAKRDLGRMQRLFNRHSVPLASLQDARSLLITAEAELKIVEDALENSVIKASFTGRITKKLSEQGEVVIPGTPVAILSEIDPILVKAAVPDNVIHKIEVGSTAYVRVDIYPQKRFKGIINRLDPTADALSRTVGVEIQLANPDEKLRPGLIATIEITHKKEGLCILVPLDAIIEFGSSPAVFVIKDLTARRRAIKTADIIGKDIEVLEGLAPGEMIVVSGQAYLEDGQPVLINLDAAESK